MDNLVDAFTDIVKNNTVADIIKIHSKNKQDIREIVLNFVNIQSVRTILDLGCGTGFFTKALHGRIQSNAHLTGIDYCNNNENPFLKNCRETGFEGDFFNSYLPDLNPIVNKKFDLILCSYALYFFPELIPQISRMLNLDGLFIAITHAKQHLNELILLVKKILKENSNVMKQDLPYEKLLNNFSDKNAYQLLSPWFKKIEVLDYKNSLIFDKKDFSDFIKYFRHKSPFFIQNNKDLHDEVINCLKKEMKTMKSFETNKDDVIFICSKK
ncbi:MAG: class I SAM-dependent methyltransferase [Bacteroidales bacterium]|nr:class I SAM-dependent methyltransferase [Bacteroidales bacterium]